MTAKLALVVLVGGCRFNFDGARQADATLGTDAPLSTDAPLGTGPFGPAAPFTENTLTADDDPTLSADALELFFDSERGGTPGIGDIYVATRADRSSPWSTPVRVTELATPTYDEDAPVLSADGLVLVFVSDRPGGPMLDNLWLTQRATRTSPWAAPALIAELNSDGTDDHFSMTADQLDGVYTAIAAAASTSIRPAADRRPPPGAFSRWSAR